MREWHIFLQRDTCSCGLVQSLQCQCMLISIQFIVFMSCHSFISGPPLDIVNVSSEVDPCDGINLTLSAPPPSDTIITYSLNDSYTNRLLIHSSFPPNSTTTNIPANLLTNHSGVYWIIVTATNPAGNGPPTNITIDLSKDNNC